MGLSASGGGDERQRQPRPVPRERPQSPELVSLRLPTRACPTRPVLGLHGSGSGRGGLGSLTLWNQELGPGLLPAWALGSVSGQKVPFPHAIEHGAAVRRVEAVTSPVGAVLARACGPAQLARSCQLGTLCWKQRKEGQAALGVARRGSRRAVPHPQCVAPDRFCNPRGPGKRVSGA